MKRTKFSLKRRRPCSFLGVFSFTGWGVLLSVGCCLSSKSEESEEEEEEEEEDWQSAWFLCDTGVEFTGLRLLLGFFCTAAGQQIGLGVNLPRTGLLVFLNSLPCFPEAKVSNASFGSLIG